MFIVNLALAIVGLAGSIVSGIFYGKSFQFEDYAEYGKEFSANPDYMILLVLSLFLLALGVIGIVAERTGKGLRPSSTSLGLSSVLVISFVYALARAARCMVKHLDPTAYMVWAIVGFVLAGASVAWFLLALRKNN